jgi:hypothetical protein
MPEVLQRYPDFFTELSGREPTFASYTRYVATGWSPRVRGAEPSRHEQLRRCSSWRRYVQEAPRKKDSLSHLSAKSHERETHPLFHPPSCRIDPWVYLLAPYEDTSRGKKGFRRGAQGCPARAPPEGRSDTRNCGGGEKREGEELFPSEYCSLVGLGN